MAAPDLVEDRELRCRGNLFGIIKDGVLEVKCKHWFCKQDGVTTYHYFDLVTGRLVETKQYKDPNKEQK